MDLPGSGRRRGGEIVGGPAGGPSGPQQVWASFWMRQEAVRGLGAGVV